MKEIRNINILAIESSCDETAAAVRRSICTNYMAELFRKLHRGNILKKSIR